ncbi:MAG: efflux RND transporter periplasmic adaptor subunit [Candidatus Promineifilaceae bacterium]|jgi:HlyD family secretion protein
MSKMMFIKRYKWIFVVVLVLLVAGLGALFLRGRGQQMAAAESDTETAVAFIGDLAESATASGQVSAVHEAALSLQSSGKVTAVAVQVGDAVSKGDVLVQLDTTDLERAVASAEYDLAIAEAQLAELTEDPSSEELVAAEAAVNSAQAKLNDLLNGPTDDEIAASEAGVQAAQAQVWAASGNVTAAEDVSEADIAAAQKALDDALDEQKSAHDAWVDLAICKVGDDGVYSCVPKQDNDKMDAATETIQRANAQVAIKQAQLDELLNPDANQVASSEAGVGSASAAYDAAVARHEELLAGASDAEIAAAEADLASAEASLDKLLNGPQQTDITIYETRVAQAQTALQQAQNNLQDATLKAPFDGLITAINVSPGEYASGVAAEMMSMDNLEIILSVDEVDVGKLAIGQPAVVTLETWPDVQLESAITAIDPQASANSNGAVSYDVHLGLPESDLPILVGMTANADLLTDNRKGVLLVPNAAIHPDRQNGTYSVFIVQRDEQGALETVPVTVEIGLKDNQFTQIVSGLNVGDEVLLGTLSAPTTMSGFGSGQPGTR